MIVASNEEVIASSSNPLNLAMGFHRRRQFRH